MHWDILNFAQPLLTFPIDDLQRIIIGHSKDFYYIINDVILLK